MIIVTIRGIPIHMPRIYIILYVIMCFDPEKSGFKPSMSKECRHTRLNLTILIIIPQKILNVNREIK